MSDHSKGVRKVARRRTRSVERPRGSRLRGVVVLLSVGVIAVLSGFWIGKYMVRTFLDPTPPAQQAGTSGGQNISETNGGVSGGSSSQSPTEGSSASSGDDGASPSSSTDGGGSGAADEGGADEPAQQATASPTSDSPVLYRVRVGPYGSREEAMETLEALQLGEYPHAYVLESSDQKVYIQVGAFANLGGAEGVRDSLIASGYPALIFTPAQ